MAHSSALVAAAAATGLLCLAHLSLPAIRRRLGGVGEGIAASVAGGVAVAYVFLHLLPEVARGNTELGELLGDSVDVTPLTEVVLFVVAFAGFLVLYGLDHVAVRAGGDRSAGVFAVHIGTFAVYNALITYTLPTRFEAGVAFSVFFVLAMALHFLLTDRSLAEHYPARFGSTGRPVLVAALVGGYLLAWMFAPTRTIVVTVMMATLAGFILYNAFSDELPSEDRVRFPAFAGSAVAYAALLLLTTAVEA